MIWLVERQDIGPKPGDSHRLFSEVLASFWQPQPAFTLFECKTFKAGLAIHGRGIVPGDLTFHVHLANEGKGFQALAAELGMRSQQERKSAFWAVPLNDSIDHEAVEVLRSKERLARIEREAGTATETPLIGEERTRLRWHQDELRRLLRTACLAGSVFIQGKDRSPGNRAVEVGKTATEILGQVLPEVFNRFREGAARPAEVRKGLDALFFAEDLQGLPAVFSSLGLLRDEKGKTVFRSDGGPLTEVFRRIEERANYGDTASGRYLADELAKEPFGWDFDSVRLLVLSLLRAGKIEATSKGQTIDSTTGPEARETFSNNNLFRRSSFRPKKGIEFEDLVRSAEAIRDTFGSEVRELNVGAIVTELRGAVIRHEVTVDAALRLLCANDLPGAGVLENALDLLQAIHRGSEANAIATFNASHRSLKDAIKRSVELEQALSEPRLRDLDRAKEALSNAWPILRQESDVGEEIPAKAGELAELLARETFFRELPAIEQQCRAIEAEYERRYRKAEDAFVEAYNHAYQALVTTPGWNELDPDLQRQIGARFLASEVRANRRSIPQLRAETDACGPRLRSAVAEVLGDVEGDRRTTVERPPSQGVEQLRAWMASPEDEHLEFKEAKSRFDFEELVRYCCALANEGGGHLILGVSDRRPRRVVGSQAFGDLQRTKLGVLDRLRLRIETSEIAHPEGRVLVFAVPPRPVGVPIASNGAYWMRSGESLVPMTHDMLKRIFDEGQPDFSAEVCRDASLSDLDAVAIERFRGRWAARSRREDLEALGLEQLLSDADLYLPGKGLTYAALILFGTEGALTRLLAQAEVVFEWRADAAAIPYQQRQELRCGLLLFHDELWSLINSRNEVHSLRDGLFRREIPSLNEDAVREAVLNAVCHRDYRLHGSTFVRQSPRRLEVVSPGGFPPEVNAATVLFRQSPRNRRLAEALARCGLVERSGQGADRMFKACLEEGKLPPDFSASAPESVSVVLNGAVQDEAFVTFLERLAAEKQTRFSVADLVALDAIHRGMDVPEAVRDQLTDLVALGAVERISRSKLVLSRSFYQLKGTPGEHTLRTGLDRETRKELLLKHIATTGSDGAPFEELAQVLPAASRNELKVLLRELKEGGRAHTRGTTRGARWHAGSDETNP
jgi:predicted HTH transcriptional regulator